MKTGLCDGVVTRPNSDTNGGMMDDAIGDYGVFTGDAYPCSVDAIGVVSNGEVFEGDIISSDADSGLIGKGFCNDFCGFWICSDDRKWF